MRTWCRGVRFEEEEEPERLKPKKLGLVEEDCSQWRIRMFSAQRTTSSSGLPCGNLEDISSLISLTLAIFDPEVVSRELLCPGSPSSSYP